MMFKGEEGAETVGERGGFRGERFAEWYDGIVDCFF